MHVRKLTKITGFTLIETLVALLLGLIVVVAVISLFTGTIGSSTNTIKSSRLNYDMESAMALMVNDIKRAGYWAGSVLETDARINPFTIGTANIQIPTASCILYTYDYDGDKVLDAASGDENEFFGFKLENGEIKISSAKTVDSTGDCSITDGRWETITNRNKVNITALQFSLTPIGALLATTRCFNNTNLPPDPSSSDTTCDIADDTAPNKIDSGDQLIENRVINIIMSGQVDGNNDITKSLSESVQIRNKRVFEQP